jgi:hypothetical protein
VEQDEETQDQTPVVNTDELKKTKWVEFCKRHSNRIKGLSQAHGRTKVPAIWDPNTNDWVWVNREQRRRVMP